MKKTPAGKCLLSLKAHCLLKEMKCLHYLKKLKGRDATNYREMLHLSFPLKYLSPNSLIIMGRGNDENVFATRSLLIHNKWVINDFIICLDEYCLQL